jgi:hypothetical protein
MTLTLPLLIPFLVTVGWEAVPQPLCISLQSTPWRDAGGQDSDPVLFWTVSDSATRNGGAGGLAWLAAEPMRSSEANTDRVAGSRPPLSLWIDEQGRNLPTSTTQGPAPPGSQGPLSSAGWAPGAFLGVEDRSGDQSFRIPLAGPVFFFGQGEKDNMGSPQSSRFVGHTGLTWKLPIQTGLELLVSCGPEVTYTDVPSDRSQERPALPFQTRLLRVDVGCRWRLPGQVGLECQGSVCPALNPGEQDAFHHDLHLAFPLTGGGRFNVGAKYSWDKSADTKLGPESGQVYGDFRLIW